jgi:putative peptidoglycan lipid II flippase
LPEASPSETTEKPLTPAEIAADSVRIEEERRSRVLEKAGRSVVATAMLISAAVFLSRLLGLARDVLTAELFGFGPAIDAFFLAFTVPNLFRKLFGEGALSSATVPVLARYRLMRDQEATRRMVGTLATLMWLVLGAICALIIGVVWIVPASTFGDPGKVELFRLYLTVLLPYVIFICLTALQSGVLSSYNRFAWSSLTPAIANLIWIGALAALFMARPSSEAETSAWIPQAVLWMSVAVLVSGVAQWLIQIPEMAKIKLLSPPRLALSEPGVKQTLAAMGPMLFALAVFQLNTFIDQVQAEIWVEGDGAVAAYSYASRLFQFPLGLVGVALSTAVFPLMSRFAAGGETEKLTASLLNSLRLLAFISLPAAAGLGVLAYPICVLLFGGPQSTPELVERTALVVILLAASLPIVSAIGLLTKAFYALRDSKTPTRIALVAVLLNLITNFIFLQTPLREAGLALGTALSGAINLAWLAFNLRRLLRGSVLDSVRANALPATSERLAQPMSPSRVRAVAASIARSALICVVMGLCAYLVEHALFGAFGLTGRTSRAFSVLSGVFGGVIAYAGLAILLRAPEAEELLALRKRRRGAAATPAAPQA